MEGGKSASIVSPNGRNTLMSHRSHGKFVKLLNNRVIIKRRVCESLAVANAVELLKLVFLCTSAAPQVQTSLAATLRQYSESDIFTAFNYLKEKNFMVSSYKQIYLQAMMLKFLILSSFPLKFRPSTPYHFILACRSHMLLKLDCSY